MNVLLLGKGKSTTSLKKLLDIKGIKNDIKEIEEITSYSYDIIVKSPSISMDNKIFSKLKGLVMSDIELVYLLTKIKMICITGTNGKTSVVSMIYECLKKKYRVCKCGNIGYPIAKAYLENKDYDYFIVEMSSYELEASYFLDPNISVILNVFPNHLDHHNSFNSYLMAKLNICKNQSFNHYAIYNNDEVLFKNIKYYTNAKVLTFSKKNTLGDFYYLEDRIYYKGKVLYKFNKEENKKEYFIYNVLAVVSVLNILNVKRYKKTIRNFKPVLYRLNKLDDYTYNDAKSTNSFATSYALKNLNNVLLICGGYKKNTPLCMEESIVKRINKVYGYGSSKNEVYTFFKEHNIAVEIFDNLYNASIKAFKERTGNEIILYSPMYQSFDQYNSFEERGLEFNTIYKHNKNIHK